MLQPPGPDEPSSGRSRVRIYVAAGVAVALAAVALLVVMFLLGRSLPLLGLREQHVGFFAPVWDANGRHVYVLKRETVGEVSGLGWEFFTPPARVYVDSDKFTLLRIDAESGEEEVLEVFEGSPLVGRVTEHYHGRIFTAIAARLEPVGNGVQYVIKMNVPRVPQSESWQLAGVWTPRGASSTEWESGGSKNTATPDGVLINGLEVLTVPGHEAYPAALLVVDDAGAYRVLARTRAFAELYPSGVPAQVILDRSGRARIERSRELSRVRREWIDTFMAQGLNETEASLRAHDAMVEQGYYPKPPQVVATEIGDAPAGLRVFQIPEEYFRVGLFQDIAQAVETPGQEVEASTGTYLVYKNDQLGPTIREWIESGHDAFVVETAGPLFRIDIVRYN